MIPPTNDRHVERTPAARPGRRAPSGTTDRCDPDSTDRPTQLHVLLDRGGHHGLGRREPDPLVHDLEAGVAGPYGHLLGAVGVPVQARLADQQPQPPAELGAGVPEPPPTYRETGSMPETLAPSLPCTVTPAHPGGRPELAEHLPQRAGPLPRGDPGARATPASPAPGSPKAVPTVSR